MKKTSGTEKTKALKEVVEGMKKATAAFKDAREAFKKAQKATDALLVELKAANEAVAQPKRKR